MRKKRRAFFKFHIVIMYALLLISRILLQAYFVTRGMGMVGLGVSVNSIKIVCTMQNAYGIYELD